MTQNRCTAAELVSDYLAGIAGANFHANDDRLFDQHSAQFHAAFVGLGSCRLRGHDDVLAALRLLIHENTSAAINGDAGRTNTVQHNLLIQIHEFVRQMDRRAS